MWPRLLALLVALASWGAGCSPRPSPVHPREVTARASRLDATSPVRAMARDVEPVGDYISPPPAAVPVPRPVPGPRSRPLACDLMSPMPGGFTAGYAADTGLDIAGIRLDVFSIAAGEIVYAEAGHSLWTGPRDTDLAVLLRLDVPLEHAGRAITHAWYAHLSELAFEQAAGEVPRRRVEAGERLGTSGVANGAWHLHLGLLLDGDTSQRWGTFLLEDDVRRALCGLRARQRLPPREVARP